MRYAVFGCGNKDWARTYQAVPKAVDARLEAAGATRMRAARRGRRPRRLLRRFRRLVRRVLGPVDAALGQRTRAPAPAAEPLLEVQFVGDVRDPLLRQNELALGTVVANRELVDMAAARRPASKRHVEIALPEGMSYRAGDYLAVLPLNPAAVVDRALTRFDLAYDAQVVVRIGEGGRHVPAHRHARHRGRAAGELRRAVASPATRRQLEQLAAATACPPDRAGLEALAETASGTRAEVLDKRVDACSTCSSGTRPCQLAFASFLADARPAEPAAVLHLVVAAVEPGPRDADVRGRPGARAVRDRGTYEGAASTYLAHARPGTQGRRDRAAVERRVPPAGRWRRRWSWSAPAPASRPFRGFLQDRALQAAGRGRHAGAGAAVLRLPAPRTSTTSTTTNWPPGRPRASSTSGRPSPRRPTDGGIVRQHRLWADRADVVALVQPGRHVLRLRRRPAHGAAVRDTCARIYQEATGAGEEEAQDWLTAMEREHTRYVADVFA